MTFSRVSRYACLIVCCAALWVAGGKVLENQAWAQEQQNNLSAEEKAEQVKRYLEQGTRNYNKANFEEALLWYENALTLEPDNGKLAALVQQTRQNQAYKTYVADQMPQGPAERKSAIKSRYEEAEENLEAGNLEAAQRGFYEIWLVTGGYKDTRDYLNEIREQAPANQVPAKPQLASAEVEEPTGKVRELSPAEEKADQSEPVADELPLDNVLEVEESQQDEAIELAQAEEEAARKAAEEARLKKQQEKEQQVRELMEAAEEARDDKEYEKAIDSLEIALRLDPDNEDLQEEMEEVQEEKAEAEKRAAEEAAEAALEEARARERAERVAREEKIDELMKQGEDFVNQEAWDEAIAVYEEVLVLDPEHDDAQDELADAREEKQEMLEQLERKRLEEEKEKARLAAEAQKEKEAREAEINALLQDASNAFEQEDYLTAINVYQAVLKKAPENQIALAGLEKAQAAQQAWQAEQEAAEAQAAVEPEPIPSENTGGDYSGEVIEDESQEVGGTKALTEDFEEPAPEREVTLELTAAEEPDEGTAEEMGKMEVAEREGSSQSQPIEEEFVYEEGPSEDTYEDMREMDEELEEKIEMLMEEADAAYRKGELEPAREAWQRVLELDPNHQKAALALEQTLPELEELQARRKEAEEKRQAEKEMQAKLNTLISISTDDPVPLRVFRKNLEILSNLDINVAFGGDYLVNATFVDKPLREVLDNILEPVGLKWYLKDGIITITSDLETEVFHLTTDDMAKIAALLDRGAIQRVIWGPEGKPPLKETVLQLDERQGILLVQDSRKNIDKLRAFLKDLKEEMPQEMVTRIYQIREEKAEETKALVEAILRTQETVGESLERKVFLQDDNLIVRGTIEDMQKVEELLNDQAIVDGLYSEKLEVATFVIVPKEELQQNLALAENFFKQVRQVIQVLLYAKDGVDQARMEGRQIWYDDVDPFIKQITITDYPDRIKAVSDFLNSLPQLQQQQREEVINLDFLDVSQGSDLNLIREMLGLQASSSGSSSGGSNSRLLRISNEQDATFMDLQIRVRRVEENDVGDDTDDDVTFIVTTPTESREQTLQEYSAAEFYDNYRVAVAEVKASGNGQGSAEFEVSYEPVNSPTNTGEGDLLDETEVELEAEADEDEMEIIAFGKQNAIVVRYRDPADLVRVRNLLKELDKPVPQVDIEALFVTVNERRAKEFSARFDFWDRDDPRNLTEGILDVQESPNGPAPVMGTLPGNPDGDGLSLARNALNGSFNGFTTMDVIMKNVLGYYVNMELSLLEAEGVVSLNNGPHIVVRHGEEAQFTIENEFRYYSINTGTGGVGGTTGGTGNVNENIIQYPLVDMSVSPQITSKESILLDDLQIQIYDRLTDPITQTNGGGANVNWLARSGDILPTGLQSGNYKDIDTQARIKNGGTIVLGGWTGEFSEDVTSGVPGLRNIPWLGKMFFSQNRHSRQRTNLLIFLSAEIVD